MSDARSSVLDLIDQICDRYELARLAGQRPPLDDYLRGVPQAERAGLLRELLRLEGAYLQADQRRRWQHGDRVRLRAYLDELPALREHPELVFELACAEVLLRLEHRDKPPRPADYLELLPGQEAQLRRFFAARRLLPAATAPPVGERPTLRAARQDTVAAPHHTVDELPAAPADPPMPPLPAPAAPPGYALLGELGRGGMGVVYQARQVSAGRVVALKMLLHAGHADADQLARFRTEAQAVARLQHRHVIQVFEVGEHQGLPFFSLEYCPGGSLDRRLAGTPLPAAEAAALVEQVARGVQAAHDAKVIHRDLKPANVLLSADGTPKVSDFGLARKLDAPGATRSGAVMGTPSYMAPEQARGQVDRLGAAVDVYALGAVLYECLTGRPPFRAAAVMDTLRQVLSEEPVPPRQLNAKVPRDLETVCLKCLEKEPGRRYASAAALAEDLGRFGRGEPVLARPVGAAERAAKWVRRNRWLAGALATVAATLLLGTALSIAFDIHAVRSANQARVDEGKAVDARNKLATTNATLTQTADELEGTLARSLLRSLALQGGDKPMTEPEWEAMWRLATDNGGRLGYRFVEEAARGGVSSRQLRDRAAPALAAAVGLDEGRRAEAERLLLAQLDDAGVGAEQKRDLALALAALGGLSGPALGPTARELTRALREESDTLVAPLLVESLSAVTARLEYREAAQAAAAFTLDLKRGHNWFSPQPGAAKALRELAARLEPKDAAQAAATLCQAIEDTTKPLVLYPLAEGLSAVAARLESKDAAQAAITLVRAIGDGKSGHTRHHHPTLSQGVSVATARLDAGGAFAILSQTDKPPPDYSRVVDVDVLDDCLSAVVARLESREAAQVAGALTLTMKKAEGPFTQEMNGLEGREGKGGYALLRLAAGVSIVAAHLEPKDATPVATALIQVIKDIDQAIKNAKDPSRASFDAARALSALGQGLSAVAARMEPKDGAHVAATLVQAINGTTDPKVLSALAQGLSAVPAPQESMRAAQVTAMLLLAMKEDRHGNALPALALALSAVAARLEPKEAAAILLEAIKNTTDPALIQGLSAVAARLEAKEAARITGEAAAAILARARNQEWNSAWSKLALARDLSALAAHLDAREAARTTGQAAAILAQAIKPATDRVSNGGGYSDLHYLAQGLAALAPHLEPRDAARVASTLTQAIQGTNDAFIWPSLTEGLSALAARLESRDAARLASTLTQAIQDTHNVSVLSLLTHGLSALAARLGPEEAGRLAGQAAAALAAAIREAKDPYALAALARAVSAVAARLGPTDAARLANTLTQAIQDKKHLKVAVEPRQEPKDTVALSGLAAALSAVAARLEPTDAAPAAATLVRAIKEEQHPYALSALWQGLRAVGLRLESETAARAAAILIEAIKHTNEGMHWLQLQEGLSAVAVSLDARDAAQVAATLSHATNADRNTVRHYYSLSPYLHSLPAVAARLEPKEAAATLIEAVKDTDHEYSRRWLTEGLSAVLSAVPSSQVPTACTTAARAVASAAGSGQPLNALAPLVAAAEPPPCRLSTQELVELLKMPICSGEVRRVVLDQLGHRYRRAFADPWAFVRFAHERQLGLDFTSPPQRPVRVAAAP
jgi:hypothetical protein